jgi:transcriptional regulator with XRE-family HTH domain
VSASGTLRLLAENGPMTAVELADALGITPQHAAANCCRMAVTRPRVPRLLHIARWQFDHPGQVRYPRPVWALGDRPNAAKPTAAATARLRDVRTYHERKGRSVTSVFDLGVPVKRRLAGERAL